MATGVVATAFGVRNGLFIGVAGLLLPTSILLFSPVLRLKDPFDAGPKQTEADET